MAGVVAVGVVAVGGAGILGYRVWDKVNGSATPEDAARQAVQGLAEGDLLAAAGTIVPAERRGLDDVARRVLELSGEGDEDQMAAFEDVEVDLAALELTPVPLGEDGIVAMVEFGGEVEVSFDREGIDDDAVVDALELLFRPAGDEVDLDDVLDAADEETDGVLAFDGGTATLDLDRFARVTGVTPWVVAVDDGSGWFLSPYLTLLDVAAFADQQAAADLGYDRSGVAYDDYRAEVDEDDGGASPEEAVQVLADAVGSGDVEDVVEAMAPDELAAWRVYRPLFGDELPTEPLPWDLDVEVEASADGDVVLVERLVAEGTWTDGFDGIEYGFELELEGSCLDVVQETFQGPAGVTVDGCLDDALDGLEVELEAELQGTDLESARLGLGVARNFERGLEVRTVEVDGRHFVSPIGTLAGWSLQALEGLTAEDIEAAQDVLEQSGDGLG